MFQQYATSGYTEDGSLTKTTHNKPKPITQFLFRYLKSGKRWKHTIVTGFKIINGRDVNIYDSYCNSTIAWHVNAGRIRRIQKGNKTYFTLTVKGKQYAKDRGIF